MSFRLLEKEGLLVHRGAGRRVGYWCRKTPQLYLAGEIHLARIGILAPEDVSLLSLDPSPVFRWRRPSVAHIHRDSGPIMNQIARWVDNVARGRDDRRQSFTKAGFVEGGTFGPVPR